MGLLGRHDGPSQFANPATDVFKSYLVARPQIGPSQELDLLEIEVLKAKKSFLEVSLAAELKALKGELPRSVAANVLQINSAQRSAETSLQHPTEEVVGSPELAPSKETVASASALDQEQQDADENANPAMSSSLHGGLSWRESSILKTSGILASGSLGCLHPQKEATMSGWDAKRRSFGLQVSADGLVCRRNRSAVAGGCFVCGNGRLQYFRGKHLITPGYYFSFKVETLEESPAPGFALGVGVMPFPPSEMGSSAQASPLYAYEIPEAVVAGYGSNYVTGRKWHHSPWDSSSLIAGDKVGLLLTLEGDLVIFVNHNQVLRTPTNLMSSGARVGQHHLYAVVDLCGQTSGIKFLQNAEPPNVPLRYGKALERKFIK